jgi:centrosomal protein CEP97
MRDILNCMTVFAQLQQTNNLGNPAFKDSSETQTEIVAVHTPQIEQPKDFPFMQKMQRPCSLPITSSSNESSATSAKSSSALNEECNGTEAIASLNETI